MTRLNWAVLRTPVGPVSVGCTATGVALVRYGAPPATHAAKAAGTAKAEGTAKAAGAEAAEGPGSRTGDADPAARVLADEACRELTEYFRGERQGFDVAVDWTLTSGLQRHVLTVLASSVGYGHTISYGTLAQAAGLTDAIPAASRAGQPAKPPAGLAARTVGTIMGGNPIPVIVPCHRVVASNGIGGYSGGAGIEVKRWLLILEGVLPPTLDWQPMAGPG